MADDITITTKFSWKKLRSAVMDLRTVVTVLAVALGSTPFFARLVPTSVELDIPGVGQIVESKLAPVSEVVNKHVNTSFPYAHPNGEVVMMSISQKMDDFEENLIEFKQSEAKKDEAVERQFERLTTEQKETNRILNQMLGRMDALTNSVRER